MVIRWRPRWRYEWRCLIEGMAERLASRLFDAKAFRVLVYGPWRWSAAHPLRMGEGSSGAGCRRLSRFFCICSLATFLQTGRQRVDVGQIKFCKI